MFFSRAAIVSFVLTTLAATTLAAPADLVEKRTDASSIVLAGVTCLAGFSTFTHTSSGFVANTSPIAVWQVLGDFFNTTWQGFALTSTTGVDNTAGAVRYFSLLGLDLSEKLTFNFGLLPSTWFPLIVAQLQTTFIQKFALQGAPYVASYNTGVVYVNDYLTAYKSNGGTQITWYVGGCSNNTAIAEGIFTQVHDPAVAGVVARFA